MAELFGGCLDDPGVELVEADVAALIRAARPRYDAILLDVDNGPEGMTQSANDQLYSTRGIGGGARGAHARRRARRVVAGARRAFAQRFEKAGFSVEDKRVRARGAHGGSRHVIWLGAPQR